MKLNFAQNFRRLRRQADLTQEQAAELFGVSPQAVSRWETGTTYPDIEILPTVAAFFSVSLEELLGTAQTLREERAEEYKNEFREAILHGQTDECIAVARRAAEEFPTDWSLQNQLMYALFVACSDDGNIPDWQTRQEMYKEEIIEIGERILTYCTDDAIRLEAKSRLGFHLSEIGQPERGRAVLETLPSIDSCRERNLYWALRGEERARFSREAFLQSLNYALSDLWRAALHSECTCREKITQLKKYEDILRILLEPDDFASWNLGLARLYFTQLAPLAIEDGCPGDALSFLETGFAYMKAYAAMPPVYTFTSPLLRGVSDDRLGDTADSRTAWDSILEDCLTKACFDPIRGDVRFRQVQESLGKLCFE